jgi:hypothetical protein
VGASWLQGLPPGWELVSRPGHGALEAVRRDSPSSVHVIVERTWAELVNRINVADARQRRKSGS